MVFEMPPRRLNAQGRLRRVGFELEYAGVDLATTAAIVRQLFGGRHVVDNLFAHRVEGARFGDFSIESDSSLLKERRYEAPLAKIGLAPDGTAIGQSVEEGLARLTAGVVPNEVVTPPIPLDELAVVEELRQALHDQGAQGTDASILAGFGLHINPETPSEDAATLLSFLRAFFLLYGPIFDESEIDVTRRALPFIKDFPKDYVALVLDPGYQPDIRQLIADYMEYTPSRNRPLDLLPLFAHIDRDAVLAKAKEPELVKSRPTFHYRLPNSLLGDPAWTIAAEWNRWVEIERLADDPARMEAMTAALRERAKRPDRIDPRAKGWTEEAAQWRP